MHPSVKAACACSYERQMPRSVVHANFNYYAAFVFWKARATPPIVPIGRACDNTLQLAISVVATAIGDEMSRNWHDYDGQSADERAVQGAQNWVRQTFKAGSATADLVAESALSHLKKMLSCTQQTSAARSSQQVSSSD